MDNVTFLKELGRMCESYANCSFNCELYKIGCGIEDITQHPEEIVAIVERWSKQNPVKTNGDMIIEFIRTKRYESLEGCDRQNEWHDVWTASIKQYFGKKWWNTPYKALKE